MEAFRVKEGGGASLVVGLAMDGWAVGLDRDDLKVVGTPAESKIVGLDELLRGSVTMLDELGLSSLLWT